MVRATDKKETAGVQQRTKAPIKAAAVRVDHQVVAKVAARQINPKPARAMNLFIKYYSPQIGGANSTKNQKKEGKAGKDGSHQRSTKKTTEKSDPDKEDTKKNANSVD
jgi:hypothetical protein